MTSRLLSHVLDPCKLNHLGCSSIEDSVLVVFSVLHEGLGVCVHCKAGPQGELRIVYLFSFIQITWAKQQRKAGRGEIIQQGNLGLERERGRSLPVEGLWALQERKRVVLLFA